MEAKALFYVGIALGFLAGIIGTLIVVKVKSLFASTEVRRLREEKKTLQKRLQEKNRYIDQMMGHAEKLANDFSRQRSNGKDR
jgi:hypothetical protein